MMKKTRWSTLKIKKSGIPNRLEKKKNMAKNINAEIRIMMIKPIIIAGMGMIIITKTITNNIIRTIMIKRIIINTEIGIIIIIIVIITKANITTIMIIITHIIILSSEEEETGAGIIVEKNQYT
jgi:hypothetical protein